MLHGVLRAQQAVEVREKLLVVHLRPRVVPIVPPAAAPEATGHHVLQLPWEVVACTYSVSL